MALMLARILIVARILNVSLFAEFAAGLLVSSTFGMLVCLGLQPMLLRDFSIFIAKRRERAGLILMAQCIVAAVACAVAAWAGTALGISLAGLSSSMLAVAVLHGLSQQLFLVATIESRSRGQPLRFAAQNLYRSIVLLLVGAVTARSTQSAAWTLAVESVASLALAQATFHTIFSSKILSSARAYRLGIRRMRAVPWHSAISIMGVTILSFALINADRWVAAHSLGPVDFAQYSFAWIVLMVAQSIQVVVNASVFPMLARKFALSGRRAALGMAATTSVVLFVTGSLVAGPVWLLFSAVIEQWYPTYVVSASLVPLLLVVALVRVSDYWSSFLMIVGLEHRLLLINCAAGMLAVLIWLKIFRVGEQSMPQSIEIAWLAVILAVSSYVATAVVSLRTANPEEKR
jgi:O-antigen/teichoic acid export membrane protein